MIKLKKQNQTNHRSFRWDVQSVAQFCHAKEHIALNHVKSNRKKSCESCKNLTQTESNINVGGTVLYYAHPYNAAERGTNENQNSIVRRFFPKGCCFKDYRDKDVRNDQGWMNNYPRKILGGKTPLMKLKEEIGEIPKFFLPRTKEVVI